MKITSLIQKKFDACLERLGYCHWDWQKPDSPPIIERKDFFSDAAGIVGVLCFLGVVGCLAVWLGSAEPRVTRSEVRQVVAQELNKLADRHCLAAIPGQAAKADK